jgi:hypothetical protein
MARDASTPGICNFCGKEMTGSGMTRHLSSCQQRKQANLEADRRPGKKESLFHLRVRDAWWADYWLHLEMRGSASLGDLDLYLRAIWLECCSHMSEFCFGGRDANELSFDALAEEVFEPGLELTHIYDFGTPSETMIQVAGVRKGKPLAGHPIFLMSRNNQPAIPCLECGQPASWWCFECASEAEGSGALCEEHNKNHPCEEYEETIPIVNSPRLGMCGYDGPAVPPY